MQSIQCKQHGTKKNGIFCLNETCHQRFICIQCSFETGEHKQHSQVNTEEFIRSNKYDIRNILDTVTEEFIKTGKTNKDFKRLLEMKVHKLMDIREEGILQPILRVLSEDRQLVDQLLEKLFGQFGDEEDDQQQINGLIGLQQKMQEMMEKDNDKNQQDQMKSMINRFHILDQFNQEIKKIIALVQVQDQVVNQQVQEVLMKSRNKVVRIFNQNRYSYKDLKELQKSEQILNINYIGKLNDYVQTIKDWQIQGQEFRIVLGFQKIQDNDDMDILLQMVLDLDVAERVCVVHLMVDGNQIRKVAELVGWVATYCKNVCWVQVKDNMKQIDEEVHDKIVAMVGGQTLFRFYLQFSNSSEDGVLGIVKKYNQELKQQKYLEVLSYRVRNKIQKAGQSRQQVAEIINQISNI